MFKSLIKYIFIFLLLALCIKPALAADLTVVCDDTDCSDPGGPLWEETDVKPGDEILRKIIIQNTGGEACALYLDTENEVDPDSFTTVLDMYIAGVGGWDVGDNKTVSDLFAAGAIYLGLVPAGDTVVFDWIVSIDFYNVGNEWQGKTAVFDFAMNFECNGVAPSPSPSPTPSPTSKPSDDGGGDDGDGGGDDSGDGGGGESAAVSEPSLTFPFGGAIRRILGIEEEAEEEEERKEVKEEKEEVKVAGAATGCCPKICPWWWIFLIAETAVLSLYYFYLLELKSRDYEPGGWWVFPAGMSIISIVLHQILHQSYMKKGYVEHGLCPYFILMSLLIGIGYTLVYLSKKKEGWQNEQD